MFDLVSHMDTGIRSMVLDALKIAAGKPGQLKYLRFFLKRLETAGRRREEHEKQGLHVPPFLIASITASCNLLCAGCYSRANQGCPGNNTGTPLGAERWARLFREAADMGVCFVLLAGGEPLLRPDVLEAAGKVPEILFPVFTNGTLLGAGALDFFDSHQNLVPVVSLEGGRAVTDARRGAGVYDSVLNAMAEMKSRRVFFGVSVTVTRENLCEVTDAGFVRRLRRNGCSLLFYVEYVPSDEISRALALNGEERKLLEQKALELKKTAKMLVISFPGDEKETGGCLAAGRGFVHVNMDGRVEPCPFSPYSDTNLADITLLDALRSPFLTQMREGGFLLGEHDGGCLLFERQQEVRELLRMCSEK